MNPHQPQLDWIDAQAQAMIGRVWNWSAMNTGSRNVAGVAAFAAVVANELSALGVTVQTLEVPPMEIVDGRGEIQRAPLGPALRAVKRADAPVKVLLNIHLDTVYGPDDPFQTPRLRDDGRMCGPGVADAKGGLVVMLTALAALEQSPLARRIGWEVVLNPDEELGSPGSAAMLAEAARRNHLGLLFEPARPDGALVGTRKGSGNFTAVVRGRAAHAGRDPQDGRNAIHMLARFIVAIAALDGGPQMAGKPAAAHAGREEMLHAEGEAYTAGSRPAPAVRASSAGTETVIAANNAHLGLTVNVGRIEGGQAVNVVPDLAIARFNVRVADADQRRFVEEHLTRLASETNACEGYSMALHGGFTAPPKVLAGAGLRLMGQIISCGRELGLALETRSSGGVSDGNKLAAAGLPNVDTLGPRGGNLHSDQEYIEPASLAERAKLTALFLLKLAAGEIEAVKELT